MEEKKRKDEDIVRQATVHVIPGYTATTFWRFLRQATGYCWYSATGNQTRLASWRV